MVLHHLPRTVRVTISRRVTRGPGHLTQSPPVPNRNGKYTSIILALQTKLPVHETLWWSNLWQPLLSLDIFACWSQKWGFQQPQHLTTFRHRLRNTHAVSTKLSHQKQGYSKKSLVQASQPCYTVATGPGIVFFYIWREKSGQEQMPNEQNSSGQTHSAYQRGIPNKSYLAWDTDEVYDSVFVIVHGNTGYFLVLTQTLRTGKSRCVLRQLSK